MEILKLNYNDIPLFSKRDKAYIAEKPALKPFYKYPVSLDSFEKIIADKKKENIDRNILVQVLKEQHRQVELHPAVEKNIDLLKEENTFTIVTAHQPSLFTGPLYYIFKIISAINLVEKLNAHFKGKYKFVPVFISGGEDHDFAEVNHLHLYNKTITWESGETGPVGNMSTQKLAGVLAVLKDILGESDNAKHIFSIIEKTHAGTEKYADAAFQLAYELFKKDGLVILNPGDARLKKLFAPIIKKEIFERPSKALVEEAHGRLEKAGFAPQAMPREINFFYLNKNMRERIVYENGKYKILNTDFVFDEKQMEEEIDKHPERFSPNVIMRPLYQEIILPNLAYIGGGGEIAYWLERKTQFEYFGINFPMLVRRNSAMWLDKISLKKMEKAKISISDIFKDTDLLTREYIANNGTVEISLEKEKKELEKIFTALADKAALTDANLKKTVLSEHAKAKKSLDMLETRLLRAEKQKHEKTISQISSFKKKVFPANGLQERYDNFLPYYLKYGEGFFEILKKEFDVLEKAFLVFVER
ncbi:MAG TPA: bacillithiol biosynthesis cysteine-adding enzyme BshC [Bacteroidetes bacterium]|nr:bacillithiol biosynthesis cysteine-adding enzyme BshC [Bacteroidota bacterium]